MLWELKMNVMKLVSKTLGMVATATATATATAKSTSQPSFIARIIIVRKVMRMQLGMHE